MATEVYTYFPSIENRKSWATISEADQTSIINEADSLLGVDWPVLPAARYTDFRKNGNRSRYERAYFDRRRRVLLNLVAEALENRGRFLEELLNGCWALCEETGWVVPAHNGPYRGDRYPELPDRSEPIVDLFAAETGSVLSAVLQIAGAALAGISGMAVERMQREITQRLIIPFLERNDFWWMGYGAKEPNNWNPWIVSNILLSTCGLPKDTVDVQAVVDKSLRCLDNFLAVYEDDGACDEGPAYWGHAAGSLFDAADVLRRLTENRVDLLTDPKIAEMGRYLYRVHIDAGWFVNYADGPAWNSGASPQLIYRYGKAISDNRLTDLGVLLHGVLKSDNQHSNITAFPFRTIWALLFERELTTAPSVYTPLTDAWLPGIQVLTARSAAGSGRTQLFFSAKGGDNHESHNHNDVGSFVLFADGTPVIIDPGVEQYTSKTFSDRRYDIWTMKSSYHNLPVINGRDQLPDSKEDPRPPKRVEATVEGERVSLALDIAPTYPAEARVESWVRDYRFLRPSDEQASLEVTDFARFRDDDNSAQLVFMTSKRPEIQTSAVLMPAGAATVLLTFGEQQGCRVDEIRVDEVPIDDPKMSPVWGSMIYRILVPVVFSDREAQLFYRFSIHTA
ncbi:MAG: heparinase II/III domain-containing protein [bacterium]